MPKNLLPLVLLLACACAAPARREAAPAAPEASAAEAESRIFQAAEDLKNRTQESYTIQPGDLIEITVFKEADMNRTVRVSGDGSVTFPLAGNVKLGGLSVPQAEALLAQKLSEFLVNPQVNTFIKEYSNKQIYVLGEVKKPGSIALPAERRLTVLEAITMAGGFTELAAPDRTKVLRRAGGQNQSLQVEISRITKQGDKSADIFLEPNDTVFVPQSFF